MNPEQQFMAVARSIGYLDNAATRTATTLAVFGRSGNRLQNLFAAGADGVDDLRRKARDLGLTLSQGDVKAAADLTDAFDALARGGKSVFNAVGAAAAGELADLAYQIITVTKASADWIRENSSVVVSLLKWSAGIAAAGGALVGLGVSLKALASVMGLLGTAKAAVATLFTFIASAATLALSPVGLLTAALVALAAQSNVTGRALDATLGWISDRFDDLASFVDDVMDGIRDALAAGDIPLAAEVLWAGLQVVWRKDVAELECIWGGFKDIWAISSAEVESRWTKAVYGVLSVWENVVAGVKSAWENALAFLTTSWTRWNSWLAGKYLDIAEKTGRITPEVAADARQINEQAAAESLAQREAERQRRRGEITYERDAALSGLEQARAEELKRIQDGLDESIKRNAQGIRDAAQEFRDAKARLDEYRQTAAERRAEREAGRAPRTGNGFTAAETMFSQQAAQSYAQRSTQAALLTIGERTGHTVQQGILDELRKSAETEAKIEKNTDRSATAAERVANLADEEAQDAPVM